MKAEIRKISVTVEETHLEMGRAISPPTRKAVAVAVIENPFAGVYQEDLTDLMEKRGEGEIVVPWWVEGLRGQVRPGAAPAGGVSGEALTAWRAEWQGSQRRQSRR